jgi:UDP-glucose 4-epimerase
VSNDGILLLGGAGFIGAALAGKLAAQGRRVHVVSRRPLAKTGAGVVVHAGDLGDAALLGKLRQECGTVVHLASTTTPGASARHPAKEFGNLAPTLQLLESLQYWPDVHLIFLSSGGTVYGNPAHNPVAENAPLAPNSYHGAGKVALEGFIHAFRATGHKVTVLRPSNAYGPGQNLQHGFGLIRTVLQHILYGTTLEIWGSGENVRDFIYVEDLVNALVVTIDAKQNNETYNIGSGKGHSLQQVVALAEQICGAPVKRIYKPARKMDVREVVLDISRIHEDLGWRPCITLEEGIQHTIEWLKKARVSES